MRKFIFPFWFQLFETSARDDMECDNVEAIFLTLAHKLKNLRPMMPVPAFQTHGNDSDEHLSRRSVISVTSDAGSSDDSVSCWC
jgi:Ras-related protein Rab-33B